MKNWWHVCYVHFMSKLLIYKQLRLFYSKLSVLIFATFQFFMFWFKTDFVKWKFQFRNLLFDLKWNHKSQKISFISQVWLKYWKRKKKKQFFLTLFWFKTNFKKTKIKIFEFIFWFYFPTLVMKLKNEKWKIFKIRFVFKSKNELYFRYTD